MFNELIEKLKSILEIEERDGLYNDTMGLQGHLANRNLIRQLFERIDEELIPLRQRFDMLPLLADYNETRWASTILAMSNIVFFAMDIVDVHGSTEIGSWAVVDKDGKLLSHVLMTPSTIKLDDITQPSNMNSDINHVLRSAWINELLPHFFGKYVIFFDNSLIPFLKEIQTRYMLPNLVVIGDNLQVHTTHYYHKFQGLNVIELCERLCNPVPATDTVLDRALAQIYILKAIAEGVTDLRLTGPKPPLFEGITFVRYGDNLYAIDEVNVPEFGNDLDELF